MRAVIFVSATVCAWYLVVGQDINDMRNMPKYDTRYDYLDVDAILDSKRLVRNYVQCLINSQRCTPEGKALKRILPEALRTKCVRCTEKQKRTAVKVIKRIKYEYPEEWAKLSTRWDPTGDFTRYFEEFLAKDNFNAIYNNGKDVPSSTLPPPSPPPPASTARSPPPPSPPPPASTARSPPPPSPPPPASTARSPPPPSPPPPASTARSPPPPSPPPPASTARSPPPPSPPPPASTARSPPPPSLPPLALTSPAESPQTPVAMTTETRPPIILNRFGDEGELMMPSSSSSVSTPQPTMMLPSSMRPVSTMKPSMQPPMKPSMQPSMQPPMQTRPTPTTWTGAASDTMPTRFPLRPLNIQPPYTTAYTLIDQISYKIMRTTELVTDILRNTVRAVVG